MTHALPAGIRAAIAAMLEGVSRNELAAHAARLSERYRGGAGSSEAITNTLDVLAYLVARMPATHAAVASSLDAARVAAPGFAPRSLLDIGAGPGTASLAATAVWPEIAGATLIDADRRLLAAAADLAAASGHPALASAERIVGNAFRLGRDLPEADLVVAAYVLAEVHDTAAAIAALWPAATGMLVLVEPGTPDGFARVRAARAALIAGGAAIAAPCPHAAPCPIVAPDWCHFSARLPRTRDHRLAKSAEVPFEDEKFAYVAAVRPTVDIAPYPARILAPPHASKAGIRLKLCRSDGTIADETAPRRDRAAYAIARRARWGDALDQSSQ